MKKLALIIFATLFTVSATQACFWKKICFWKKNSPVETANQPASPKVTHTTTAQQPFVTKIAWGEITVQEPNGSLTQYDDRTGKDCILLPTGSKPWDWLKTGMHHKPGIQVADVQNLLNEADIFILSRGMDLVLEVMPETITFLKNNKKEVHTLQSEEAVALYNKLTQEGKKVVGLIHSTC